MKLFACTAAFALSLITTGAFAEEAKTSESYPLTSCPISGEALKDGGVVKVYEGREIRFCCGGCPAKFEGDLAANMANVDTAIIADQKERYALTTCPVMEHDIEMEKAHWFVVGNRAFATCCPSCEAKVAADPATYTKTLNAAVIEKQDKDYPLETCIVAEGPLGDSPVNTVVAGRLMKTCCAGCAGKISADPALFISKLTAASKN